MKDMSHRHDVALVRIRRRPSVIGQLMVTMFVVAVVWPVQWLWWMIKLIGYAIVWLYQAIYTATLILHNRMQARR
jgi:hypothetical protein